MESYLNHSAVIACSTKYLLVFSNCVSLLAMVSLLFVVQQFVDLCNSGLTRLKNM
jgi:hypothetical protein